MSDKILAYKGFDKDFKCRGYSFEVGKDYEQEGKIEACKNGFHACEYPLDIFNYYIPSDSKFAIVELSGDISRESNGDSKIASAKIHIKAEIKISDLVSSAIEFIMNNIKFDKKKSSTNDKERSLATNTGNYSASTNTGYQSVSTNTGNYSASTNTGTKSASTNTGIQSVSTNTGTQSVSTNTGDYSVSTNTGDYSVSTNTGTKSASTVEGLDSVAIATGYEGKARACIGSAIVLCYRDNNYNLIHIKSEIVDGINLKENTFYILDKDGNFQEDSQ